MWFVFDNESGTALPCPHPKACFETALILGWKNFTIEKGKCHV